MWKVKIQLTEKSIIYHFDTFNEAQEFIERVSLLNNFELAIVEKE